MTIETQIKNLIWNTCLLRGTPEYSNIRENYDMYINQIFTLAEIDDF